MKCWRYNILNVVDIVKQSGYTQKYIAEKSKVTECAISKMMALKQIPKIDTVKRILDVLGYTVIIAKKEEFTNG